MDVFAKSGSDVAPATSVAGGVHTGLVQVMDELAHGVLITSLDSKVLHANQAARHELAKARSLTLRESWLQAATLEGGRVLADSLVKAGEGKRSLITLASADGVALTVAVIALPSDSQTRTTRAALMFARASVCESLMLCFFARSHNLTTTEEHVLEILCQGYSAPQIAVEMKVAVSTIRSHVRSLCAKTRSSGVRELVKRVAVLPPVAPAFWH